MICATSVWYLHNEVIHFSLPFSPQPCVWNQTRWWWNPFDEMDKIYTLKELWSQEKPDSVLNGCMKQSCPDLPQVLFLQAFYKVSPLGPRVIPLCLFPLPFSTDSASPAPKKTAWWSITHPREIDMEQTERAKSEFS